MLRIPKELREYVDLEYGELKIIKEIPKELQPKLQEYIKLRNIMLDPDNLTEF